MNEDVRAALLRHRSEKNGSDYVFVNPDTKKPPVELKRSFSTALRLAGIHDLHWHDLRHTFGTRLAEAGFSEATIAELMGHADAATTRRYTHGTDRAKRAAVEAVRVSHEPVCHKSATNEERPPMPMAASA
jgi:integrase